MYTYLFLDWPLPEGRAFLFLGASGAGVARGLVVFAFGAVLPKTALMARSAVAVAPLVGFSTLRRFCGGLPLLFAAAADTQANIGGFCCCCCGCCC